jgi:hypothetical protein
MRLRWGMHALCEQVRKPCGNTARAPLTNLHGNKRVMTDVLTSHGRSCSASLRNSLVARNVRVSQ